MSKTIFRTNKDKDNPYVMMDKRPIENPLLTWKAKGVLSYLLSRPDDWIIQIGDLIKRSPDGSYAVRAAVKELIEAGHIIRRYERENGRIKQVVLEVYERPLRENLKVENLKVENRVNTNIESTNKEITNITPQAAKTPGDLVDGILFYSQKGKEQREAGIMDMEGWPVDVQDDAQEFARVFKLPIPQARTVRGDWIQGIRDIQKEAHNIPLEAIFQEGKALAEKEEWLKGVGRPAALVKSIGRIIRSIQAEQTSMQLEEDGSFYV